MKNKGQALVEFIIILPVLLLLILGAIDFGNILYKEYTLENDLDYVVELVRQNKMTEIDYYVKQKELTKNIETKSTTTTVTLSKKVVGAFACFLGFVITFGNSLLKYHSSGFLGVLESCVRVCFKLSMGVVRYCFKSAKYSFLKPLLKSSSQENSCKRFCPLVSKSVRFLPLQSA